MLSLSSTRFPLGFACGQLRYFFVKAKVAMARIKSTARLCDGAPVQEDEGAAVERGPSGDDQGNNRSTRGSWSVHVSDVSSLSNI
jgi:hypothetical protein